MALFCLKDGAAHQISGEGKPGIGCWTLQAPWWLPIICIQLVESDWWRHTMSGEWSVFPIMWRSQKSYRLHRASRIAILNRNNLTETKSGSTWVVTSYTAWGVENVPYYCISFCLKIWGFEQSGIFYRSSTIIAAMIIPLQKRDVSLFWCNTRNLQRWVKGGATANPRV